MAEHDDVFTGTVSASTPLSIQLIGLLNGIINFENFKIYNTV